ncbi:hypothetical protein C9374_006652 [Naegleria lovaniensis]|uniref:Nodulin-like domain-containing protein n=1 Tax=Naegleria lovaniensis TaxID=51637 RepID=A0AA88GMH9_NAELO|nr:uncharacterized protein C9374_006652 [Naegleria lovaniensis]KAG2379535.1 hypothetical protein C9374_006652 [Naegleria lovaniensis]
MAHYDSSSSESSSEGSTSNQKKELVVSHSKDSTYGAIDVAASSQEKNSQQEEHSTAYYQQPRDDEPLLQEGLQKKRKITFRTVFDFSKKWLALIIGCLMMLVSGTQYAFSSISPTIKRDLGYSQYEVTTIAALANLGTYFSLPISLVNDFAGARICSIVSAGLYFTGYFLFLLLYLEKLPNHYILGGIFFLIMGSGSAGGYLASMSTNLKNFSETNRGLVVGILASCFGLSSFFFSSAYSYIFSQALEPYLLFTAIFGTVVLFSGCIFMNTVSKGPANTSQKTSKESKEEESAQQNSERTSLLKHDDLPPQEPPMASEVDNSQEEGAVVTYEEAATTETPLKEKKIFADISANNSMDPPVLNPFRMLLTLDFYMFFIVYTIAAGCGLVIINNLGSIVLAYGGYHGQQNVMVQLLSVFNCVGRIVFGFLSDKFLLPHRHLTRISFFNMAVFMMGVVHFIFAWIPVNGIYGMICVMGFFNGGIFSLAPSFCSERYGSKYFGMNFSIVNLAAAAGSYALATSLAGKIYQDGVIPPRITTCHGRDCFQLTFFITTALCGFALILGLVLQYRTRWVYGIFYRRRMAAMQKQSISLKKTV